MKKTFPGYYCPTEDEFSELWQNCLFVLDANVLLNLYRYSPGTSEELIGILKEISDRLWVPHQAALEYQNNRLVVIEQQAAAYDAIQDELRKTQDKIDNELRSFARHPFIEVDRLLERIKNIFAEIGKELNELKQEHPDLFDGDHIRDAITVLLEGKVGSPYSFGRMDEIYKEGKTRYEHDMPPGYLDRDKGSTRQYGDLVLWFQIIDKAKETKKPIIFITDDRKDDWWWRFKGKTIGPRPELIEEMLSQAGVSFYMYQSDPFMEHAQAYLKRQVKQEAIDEVREVRLRDEESMKAAQAATLRLWEQAERLRAMQQEIASRGWEQMERLRAMDQETAVRLWEQAEPLRAMQQEIASRGWEQMERLKAMDQETAVRLRERAEQIRAMEQEMASRLGKQAAEQLRAMEQVEARSVEQQRIFDELETRHVEQQRAISELEPEEEPDESDEQPEMGDE
jgi:hypothetical protein